MELHRRNDRWNRALATWMVAGLLLAPLPVVASDPAPAEPGVSAASDVRMHLELETRLAASEAVSAFEIGTDVENGVVYLDGTVESGTKKELIAEIAQSIDGVRSVRNGLVVADREPGALERMQDTASDVAVTTAVKTRLLANGNTSGLDISVDSSDGVVTLSGAVDSIAEKELAAAIAANTAGVSRVRNKIDAGTR